MKDTIKKIHERILGEHHRQMRNFLEYLGTQEEVSKKDKDKLIQAYNDYVEEQIKIAAFMQPK